jgi:hypothetical protein
MNILTQTRDEIKAQFSGERFAQALIGGFPPIESAWEYDFGGTLTVRIGYYNAIARYACFIKATLGVSLKFAPQEVEACLISISPTWTVETPVAAPPTVPTVRYRCSEGAVVALAWHKNDKPYVFAYVPSLPGQRPVIPNQASIDQRFPTVFQVNQPHP